MDSRSISKSYDAYYYAHGCGDRPYDRDEVWLGFFGSVANRIVNAFRPTTLLDAGCAIGLLVESLRDRGVAAYGIDISEYAISQVREDIRPFCRTGSLTEPLPQSYDLIVCIEVLEHLSADEGQQ
ncbi:MAG TPA: methyltransferase domain-containing protein, partial [Blastocatellia bacterium]|nr:methyltransferase domain-containing protein [Blastocatellia bacterium]